MLPEAELELGRRTLPTGEQVADIGGELDIVTADVALEYVRGLIDGHHGPVVANLARVSFCDARGLRALLLMADYAHKAGCAFRVDSPTPMVARLMKITGLEDKFFSAERVIATPEHAADSAR
jgi:anti-anti-sigma factor